MNIYAVLPEFPTQSFAHILPSLERHEVSVADLLSLEATDVAKRAQVPTREVRRLTDAILKAIYNQYDLDDEDAAALGSSEVDSSKRGSLVKSGLDLIEQCQFISVLDNTLDNALCGGFPTRYITEVTGESGVGKTQLLLTLLLSVQLPAPVGLGRSAIYISTEAPLQTSRLAQIIEEHSRLSALDDSVKPSLSRIFSIQTPDLEYQDHILRYQVPVLVKRQNVGLLVIDSVTTNFRAELDRHGEQGRPAASMAKRAAQLMQLGILLRHLARTENLAVVVANQVADRFNTWQVHNAYSNQSGQATSEKSTPAEVSVSARSPPVTQQPPLYASLPSSAIDSGETLSYKVDEVFTLEHQQRWFTGWGDQSPLGDEVGLKTPSLGLVWANEIACRIALIRHRVINSSTTSNSGRDSHKLSRHFKLVFAPWAPSMEGSKGIEFRIGGAGIEAVTSEVKEHLDKLETIGASTAEERDLARQDIP